MLNPYNITNPGTSFINLKAYEKDHRFEGKLRVIEDFKNFISRPDYSCLGAQTSLNSRSLCFGLFDDMFKKSDIEALAWGLVNYIEAVDQRNSNFLSYVALFENSNFDSEVEFEKTMWALLGELHLIDKKNFDWDSSVSNDPRSNKFSYSFGGRSFFVVGMHPQSSRRARAFKAPALAFNLHSQFEGLRSRGKFETMKKAIRKRELNFQGSINPMLSDYGDASEARQYSGRVVEKDWRCPFKH